MTQISPLHRRYLLLVAILLLVIFYLVKCTGTTEPVITTPTKVLKDTLRLIEQDRKHISDSFETILQRAYKNNYRDSNYLIELLNQNSELSAINQNLQKETFPDTCREIVGKYQKAYDTYSQQTQRLIEQGKRTISGLNGTVATQRDYLKAKDTLYNRLKKIADTCLSNSQKLEQYAKSLKPRRSINLNVQTISPYLDKIKPIVGAGFGYVNKQGLQIYLTYYTNNQISIGISKPLFHLK